MTDKIDFGQTLIDLEGNDLHLKVGLDQATLQFVAGTLGKLPMEARNAAVVALNEAAGKPLTLYRACIMALGAAYEDERQLGGDERLLRYKLGMRLKAGRVRVSGDDVKRIKDCVRKCFVDSIVAPQVCLLLDGQAIEPTEEPDEDPTA